MSDYNLSVLDLEYGKKYKMKYFDGDESAFTFRVENKSLLWGGGAGIWEKEVRENYNSSFMEIKETAKITLYRYTYYDRVSATSQTQWTTNRWKDCSMAKMATLVKTESKEVEYEC